MNKKLRIAIFKLIDLMVIFTMVFGSPMSITASAMSQDSGPTLVTDESDYETGDSARITGSGFTAGEYVLAAGHDDDILDWGSVAVNESGLFVTDSPTLDTDGAYEVRAYASGWSGDWEETPLASASFTVSAPSLPTETSTQEPTATEPPTEESTATEPPTEEPTATEPPTAVPTATLTEEPTATEPPTEEPTITPTDEPTEESTNTPTDEPTEEPTTEPTATETPTDEPTAEPTNSPTDEPTATEPPTAEPTDTPTDEQTATSTTEPTNTPTEEPTSTPRGSPTIVSDQTDYPPGAVVTLTGTNWQGDTTVSITVDDDQGKTWYYTDRATVKPDGTITDTFTLPTHFVAQYFVRAVGIQTGRVATTTFADSAPTIGAKQHEGQLNPSGTFTSGNITTYQEGNSINFRFNLEANHGPSTGTMEVRFSGQETACLFFEPVFVLGAIEPLTNVGTTSVSVASGPTASGDEWVVVLNVSWNGAFGPTAHSVTDIARVNYTLTLSDEAGECTGSSQHSRLAGGTGVVAINGAQNVPVPASQIVELPEITVIKNIDRDGNGSFEDTANAGEYCFSLDGGTCVPTDGSGTVIFTNVTPNGAHTVTETQLDFSQGTYNFVSGSGTNCTFSSSTATATVASGSTSTNATCIFNNGLTTGTLTIVKVVVNDNGGTKQVSDFPLFYNGTPATSGVANSVSPGTYTVTETQQAGYTATFSGDCNSSGVVTVGSGQNKTCTITNDDQPGTLIVIKDVINNNGGSLEVDDFSFEVNGGSAIPFEADGQNNLTVDAGTYDITEPAVNGYATSYDNCTDVVIPNGGTATCTITNDDQAGTIIVEKQTDPDGIAGDFEFTGDAAGTISDGEQITVSGLAAGTYTSTELVPSGWELKSIACSDSNSTGDLATDTATFNLENGETVTCVFTNDPLPTVTLDKSASPTTLPEPGGVFTFTLSITNTSVEDVTITALTDDNALSQECQDLVGTTLAAGAGTSCSYTVTHTEAGTYPNTASVTVTDDEGNEGIDSDDETVTVTDELPTVTLHKSASPTTLPEPGGVFTFTLTITNTSAEDVTITTLTDDNALSQECTALIGTTLAAGASTSCSYSVTHIDAGTYPNTASVTVTDDEGNEASDSDNETVTVTDVAPTVTLDKSASPSTLPEPVGVFTFTLTITNTSIEDVTITVLTDDNALSQECQDLVGTTLAAGGSTSCQYTVTHTNAGSYDNTASVTVADDENNEGSDSDDETVTVTDASPTVTLDKSASPTTLPEPGGVFTFTLTITNTSVETVEITALTDDNALSQECQDLIGTTLAAGAVTSCQYTVTHTDAGSYPNTANVTVEDDEGNEASDDDSETVSVTDELPTVILDKGASPTTLPEPGGLFTFTLTITNTSIETVTITALTDDNTLSAECLALIGTTLAAGASTSCIYTVTHTDAGSYDNTASVTVTDDEANESSDIDDETVTVTDVLPTVDIVKSASPTTLPEPGGVFTFTLTITNTSIETVTITALTDDHVLSQDCQDLVGTTLAAGASTDCTYTVTHTDAGSYDNTASVTVADDEGNPASDTDDETVTVTDVSPTVDLVKNASPTTLPEPGGVFTFTLEITNTSVEDVTITALTDDNALSQECLNLIGDTLTPNQTVTCSYTVTHTDAGSYPNTANVTVEDDEGNEGSDSDDETVTVTDELPTVDLTKTASPITLPEPGGVFTFTLTITNTSVETVEITALTDTNTLSQECQDLVGTFLDPSEIVSCQHTVTHTDAGSYDNTASVTVADDETNEASDSDDETVTVTDVAPTVTLTKSASPTTLPEPGGVFTFTLTVTNTSSEDVTITALTDDNALSAECTALIGTTLAAGASTSCSYTVTHTDAGSYDNTASVTVEDDEGNPATDTDDETVTVTDVTPTVTLDKSASPTTLPEPGGVFTFTLIITNTSVETITITALTDDNTLSQECQDLVGTTLAAGASTSCTYTITHTDAGTYPNTASVTVADNENNEASDSDDETVTVTDVLPTVDLVKSASPTTLPEPGGVFTFTLIITNTSVETVTISALTDTQSGATDFSDCAGLIGMLLLPGASTSCQYTVTHTDAGSYDNTASVTVADNENNEASDSDDETVTVTDVTPTVTLDKSVTPASLPEPGGVFTFTLTITNTSVEIVTITALTDDNALSQECQDLVGTALAAGASTSCSYTVTHTDAGSYPNTANVTVADDEDNPASDTDDETVTITDVAPTVTLTKSASPTTLPEPGGVFTFTLTITNTSVETVTITALTDDNALSQECQDLIGTTLAAGASTNCTYTVTHTDAGSYPNTASVSVADDEANEASYSDDETVTVTDELPTVTLDKSASPMTLLEPGGVFTFTLTITNTSVEDVTITALTDDNLLSQECQDLVGDTLTPGQIIVCTYTVTHTDAGSYPNTASVTVADDEANEASDSDDETVIVTDELPTVTLDKSASPTTLPEPGGVFTFTLTITNTSVEDVTISALTDDNVLSQECQDLVGDTLTPGQIITCTYTATHTDAGSYPNTASVTVADDEANEASDSDDETVTVTDVAPTVTLDKSASPTTMPEPGGVFTFTLTITNTSVETVTITALTDDNALSAQCLALVSTTLAAGASTSCTYTVTHTDAGSYDNTASVTVEDNEANPASDSDDETVTVTDVTPTVDLNKSVDDNEKPEPGGVFTFTLEITNTSVEAVEITALTDDNALSQECQDLVGITLAAGASTSCTYTVTHTDAGSYDNTASVTVADNENNTASDSDDETVTVTDVAPTVTLDKSASPTTLPEPGGVFTFILTITNTSVETVTITALTDNNALSAECTALIGTTLAAGAFTSCTYTVTHTDAGSYDNTASVTVEDNEGNPASDTDDETVTVTDVLPTVDLIKSVTPASLPEPGGVFTFTLTITNTSVEDVTITALTDDNTLSAECTALIGTTLAAGASTDCAYTVTHTDAGSYPNTASVTVADDEGNPATDTDDETVTVTDVLPTTTVDKTANPTAVPETGANVTFTFKVTNNSVESVTITSLSDSDFGTLTGDADCQVGTVLAAGASCTFTSVRFISGDFESGVDHTNTFTAHAEDNENNDASDDDDAMVDFTNVTANIDVEKYVSVDNGATWIDADSPTGPFATQGNTVKFKFVVTNNSSVTLSSITLTDSDFSLAGCTIPATLATGASFECIISTTAVTSQHTNTATTSGSFTDGAGNTETDSDTDDANYYGLQRGQPSIAIKSLSININRTRTTVTGQFNITDESEGGNTPDGFLVALIDYGVRWQQKGSGKNAGFVAVVPSGGCTYRLISKDGVTYNQPLAPGEDIIFDESVTIGYTCTFGSTQLTKGGTLRGTAFASVFGRTGMEFTFTNTASIPK